MDLKNIADIYPLSPVQDEELSRHRRRSSSSGASPVEGCGQIVCHLRGRLDAVRFEAAWAQVATRHTALRSFFVWEKLEKPLRLIPKQLAISVEQHDWSGDADSEARLRNFLMADAAKGFDPAAPPLVRLSLCRESENSHRLVCTYHKLLLDERSARFVLNELFKSYGAGSSSSGGDAAAARPDFKSYIEWLKRQDATRAESLWRDALDGFDAPAQFLSQRDADTSAAPQRGHERLILLAPATLPALRNAAGQHGLDLADAIRAAWAVVLSGYSGAPEVLFGVRVAARPSQLDGSESIVGAFANTLPARVRVTHTDTVAALLQQLGEGRSRLSGFEYSTATQASAVLAPSTNGAELANVAPLFESVLSVRETSEADRILWAGAGLEVSETLARGGEVSPLVVEARATADGKLIIEANYATNRFDAEGATRLLGHLREVLEDIAATDAEQQTVSGLSLLPDAERRLLAGWNDTRSFYPRDRAVHELFEEQVARTPDTVALVAEGVSLSYAELNARSNQLANYLRSLGVGPEMLVGICMERSVEMIVGILGVLKAGGAYVPLDPAYPMERLSFMLADTQTPVLLTQERLLDELPAHWGQVVCLDDDWETIALHGAENQPGGAGAGNLVYVMYTSGSTGRPKGVGVTHRSVVRLVKETNYAHFLPEDVFLQLAPFSFDASTFEIWGALLNGARLALMPARTPSLDEIGEALNAYGVTTVWLTAGLFHLMVSERPQDLANLRQLLAGGDVLSVPHVRTALDHLQDGRVINGYGPTESTTFAVCHPMSSDAELGASVPIGRVISNTRIHIVNRQMETLPVGVAGELLIGGDGLARGYLNRPELTAERFIPDPFSDEPGARLYRTGDLARYLSDGSVEFLGRIDQQVKVRGFRVELGEIEAALGGHPSVRDCVVTAREDAPGDKRLVAYVVVAGAGAEASAAELRAYLKGKLPEYMLPTAYVVLDELPLTPNGKVDRRALPTPDAARPELEETFAPPTTPEEQTLTEIWAQVLGLARVGIHDNFFDLGGDSIRSIQIRAQARARGLDFSIQQLFQHQTIHELAQVVEVISAAEASAGKSVRFGLISEEDRLRLPTDVEDAYPLSRLQAGMLFHSDFNPESAIYHDMFSFHLQAPHELETLTAAIRQLIERHAVLRTSFDLTSYSEPLQLVHREIKPLVEVSDLRHLTHDEQEKTLAAEFEAEKKIGFDWKVAPLIRFKVCRRAEAAMQFDVGFHHAILDGWSVASMLTELFQLYLAMLRGDADSLPAAPVASFREFVALERAALTSDESQRFWNELLRDSPSTLLPRLTSIDQAGAHTVRQLPVDVPREVSDGVRQLAQASNVPVKSVLLAAHLRVMSLLAGQADVVTGVVANGRPEERDGERVLGLFLNNLPFRFRLEGGSWRDFVRETFEAERAIVPHRRYPMVELQRALGGQTLFETCFNFTHFHVYQGVLDLDGIAPVDVKFFEESNFPVITQFSQDITSQRVLLRLDYMTGEMSDEQMAAIARYYVNVLTAMTTEPEARYETCALLAETERHQLLEEWNDTARDYPRDASIHQLFEAQAAASPDRVALTFGDEQFTYRELNARANQLAHHLRGLGVGADTLVGIMAERSVEMVTGLLGILKAGGAYVPLDAEYPAERLSFMLADARVSVLLTQERLLAQLPEYAGRIICLDAEQETLAREDESNPAVNISPVSLAYMIYTSGSTGRPKGAMNTHAAIVNRLLWMQDEYGLTTADRVLQKTPFSFDVSVWEFFWPLITGARLVVARPGGHRDAAYLVNLIAREQITTLHFVPSMLQVFLDESDLSGCASLHRVICSGEALSIELQERFFSRLVTPQLHNLYGPTEAAVDVTYWACERTGERRRSVPIGRPIANTQIYIVDGQLRPVPVGVAGELLIGGAGLARGYFERPALTAEKFIADPFSTAAGGRVYRTGDLARFLADGNVEYLGRLDHQVKIRGHRIELGEIEAALEQHAEVKEALLVAREEAGGDKRLVAYLVAGEGATPDASALRAYLKTRLPEYMIPSAFVSLNEMPLTPNGKVDRKTLPAPDASQSASGQPFVAPRTFAEEMLANIWCDVLGIARVGVNDNFFDLGGHSLLATQVMSRVRSAFSIELPLRTLFDSPTVATLAPALASTPGGEGLPTRPPLRRQAASTGTRPLSFAQQRLWFLAQLTPGSAAYNVPVALRLRGELDAAALAAALSEVECRHEVLRTKFVNVDGLPAQVVGEAAGAPLVLDDLRQLPVDLREAEAQRLASEAARLPFDLADGPVWRTRLLRLSEDDHVLLVTLHHIVSDAWSLGVIVRELSSLYRSFAAGEESALPELEIQYGDYAEWQRGWLQGEALETQLAYWRTQLAGGGDALALPTDRPRPPVQTYRGATQEFVVSAELGERLKALSRREGATLFMTLLAAFQTLLHRYAGREDISVGTPIAGRAQLETEALIGFFVNTLVLRTDLSGEPSFGQLLRRVREVCLGAFNHQDVPFEKLVEELQPERSMSHSPLFQVMFSLQNAPIGALELPGLTLSEMSPEGEGMMEKFDITLTMHESGDSIGGTFSYSTDLFDHATIERMAEHFMRLLEEAALAPERSISELEMSSGAERRRLLVEWNETCADYARDRVLHELFEEQVKRTPAAIAVVSGNESLTYAELDGRANQLAHHLRGLGAGAESLVAVCAERSVEMVVGLLGVLKAGGAYVPLDPAYPMERLSFMLNDSRASILLTQERLLEKLSGVAARVVCLDADWEIIAGESVASPHVHVGVENPAYVIYTSGSTGRPKGVVVSHSAICNHMTWMQTALPLDASDAVLQKTPFSFDASVWEFYAPLLAGARLVMAEPGGHQDGSYLVRVIEEERITILQTVPSLLRMLLAGPGLRRCLTLRRLFCGGEPLTRELQERLYEQLDAVTLYNLYGPTEATIEAGAWECERKGERRVVPIGRPIFNAQMYVLDKHRQPVPQGTVGELYIGGAGLARGYLHRPDLTAQKFVPHPFSEEPGARLYQTGDLARHLPDGALEFLGRADHQVKVRGFRIELGEIEAALNELETVGECVVMAREDVPGEQRLVAYLVAGAGGMSPASELRELLRAKLPEHMIPTLFVELDELPLTPNGKLDRGALPAPARGGAEAVRNFVAPRTAVEEIVAELWSESLGLERLGVRDNFFEVGGHSLVAALLISRLRDAFQIDIPLSVFFNTTPTVERMSEAIEMLLLERASDGDVEKILAELDGLSDDEVKAVLTGGDGRDESNAEAL